MGTLHPSASCPDLKFPRLRAGSSSFPSSHIQVEGALDEAAAMTGGPPDIQSHMYESFLHGRTADVALRVRAVGVSMSSSSSAGWEGVYRLHRVVLIQAGFFHSLFDGGFRESSPRLGSHLHGPEEVDVTFDDPNITRAAFEVCIARLYGGGPPLFVDPDLIPSPLEPLTASFPHRKAKTAVPAGHHPATPRFLLSLLATSVYLSIPHVIKQALTLILNSVGPHTVVRYLNFSIGEGIGDKVNGEPEAATGLEHVAQLPSSAYVYGPLTPLTEVPELTIDEKFDELSVFQKDGPSHVDAASIRTDRASIYTADGRTPSCFYGPLSDKIGESAACWLVRWGKDTLTYEDPQPFASSPVSVSADSVLWSSNPEETLKIWSRGGINSKWASAILSSDSFFIGSERERYNFARRVVELRRRDGVRDDEESDWEKLFSDGIHYMHMSADDLMAISRDMSPTTGKPYVPLPVLQAALWQQSMLRQTIIAGSSQSVSTPTLSAASVASAVDKTLGIAVTTSHITELTSVSAPNKEMEEKKIYHPVPIDRSVRIGNGLGRETIDELLDPSLKPKSAKLEPAMIPTADNFFGMLSPQRTAASCSAVDTTGKSSWSPFPPFRFAVEFWGAKDKSRLYSHTIWYAGSLYNVYAQVVRKKGIQLGVYLHRQSSVDTIPLASSPPSLYPGMFDRREGFIPQQQHVHIPTSPSTPSIVRPPSTGNTRQPGSRSTTPGSPIGTRVPLSVTVPAHNAPPHLPPQPYRDPRPSVLAYFSIHCASATGSSLTRFSSAPDVFAIGQSWGWKSSSLRADEYVEVSDNDDVVLPKEVSLRATVVIGLV